MSVLSLSFAKDFAASGTPLLNLAQLELETQLCKSCTVASKEERRCGASKKYVLQIISGTQAMHEIDRNLF
jgi:hypothetical protein